MYKKIPKLQKTTVFPQNISKITSVFHFSNIRDKPFLFGNILNGAPYQHHQVHKTVYLMLTYFKPN